MFTLPEMLTIIGLVGIVTPLAHQVIARKRLARSFGGGHVFTTSSATGDIVFAVSEKGRRIHAIIDGKVFPLAFSRIQFVKRMLGRFNPLRLLPGASAYDVKIAPGSEEHARLYEKRQIIFPCPADEEIFLTQFAPAMLCDGDGDPASVFPSIDELREIAFAHGFKVRTSKNDECQREMVALIYIWDAALGYAVAGKRPHGIFSNAFIPTLQEMYPRYKRSSIEKYCGKKRVNPPNLRNS